jgi:hypothetical protein
MKNILLLIVLFAVSLPAGIIKKGQVGFRFLENPISAEAIGRGGLGVTAMRSSNAVFWNPAGLGWMEGRWDFSANYTKGIADINSSALAAAWHWPGVGVFAVDGLFMDYGDFYGTRRANNAFGFEETGVFSPQALAVGLAFSQRVSDRFSYGVHVKYAHQDLGSAWVGVSGKDVDDPQLQIGQKAHALTEPAVDVGAVYDFLNYGIRFGAAIQNFSREIRYQEEKFPLPFAVSFSLMTNAWSFFRPDDSQHSVLLGFETRHGRDFKERVKVGGEYHYRRMLVVRSGYMGNYDERGLTFGFGLVQKLNELRLAIDYAFQDFGVFKSVHTFSFSISH